MDTRDKPARRARGVAAIAVHVQARLAECEDMLASGIQPKRVVADLRARHGLSKAQGSRYLTQAYARWAQEAGTLDRDARRNQMRATLWAAYCKAMNLERTGVTDGKTYTYPAPDLRSATSILDILCRLDGLISPPTVNVAVGVVGEQAIAALANFFIGPEVPSLPASGSNGRD